MKTIENTLANTLELIFLWSSVTILIYALSKALYQKFPLWWLAPVIVTPILLITICFLTHTAYADYIGGTQWLFTMIGPATVAFAVPIYQRRAMIQRYWRTILIGIVFGSAISMLSAWGLATLLQVDDTLRLSLLPRSVSNPFAMGISKQFGGIPELTAVFVIFTGIFGAAYGEAVLYRLPITSTLARGFSFGLGAHAVGSSKAYEINREEGTIAALIMVLTGIFNVLMAPLLQMLLK